MYFLTVLEARCPRFSKFLASLISSEAFLLGLQMIAFSLCSHMAFSLCTHILGVPPSSHEDTSLIELESYPYNII